MANKKNAKGNAQKSPKSVTVVVNDFGLTAPEASAALVIKECAAEQVKAVRQFKDIANKAKGYFWDMVAALRLPVSLKGVDGKPLPPMRLNAREITLLLLSEGFNKVRVSEINTVAQLADDVFAKAQAMALSKDDTLRLARGTAAIAGEGDEAQLVKVEKEPAEGAKAKATAPEYHKANPHFRDCFASMMGGQDVSVSWLGKDALQPQADGIPYEWSGETSAGVSYEVRVFVSQKPTKSA